MATRRAKRWKALFYFVVDLVALFLFAFAGRTTRGSDFGGTVIEALPFFVGAAVGWLIARAWRHPRVVRWEGVKIWACTFAIGLPLRALLGDPTDSRFVSITFVALGVFLLGWRAVAWILEALFGRAIEKTVDEKYRR